MIQCSLCTYRIVEKEFKDFYPDCAVVNEIDYENECCLGCSFNEAKVLSYDPLNFDD